MKKFLAIFLALVLTMALLAGCAAKAATGVADCKLPQPVLWGYSAEAF